MKRTVRRLRHWKQRFDKDAAFIWNKHMTWDGEPVVPGAVIPDALAADANRLRRFWEAGIIQLAQFEEPDVATGQAPEPVPEPVPEPFVKVVEAEGGWQVEGFDDATYESREAAEAALAAWLEDQVAESATVEPVEPVEPVEEDEEPQPEDLVKKLAERKWVVIGKEDVVYPSKKAALDSVEKAAPEPDFLR
jgi:hypothetical protein